jgi:hypothetical protein
MKKKEILQMVGVMCAGVFANPTSGDLMHNRYGRQYFLNEMIQDTISAIQSAGIIIEEDEEASHEPT